MAASYPTSIKSNFSTKAHGHVIYASHLTDIEDEVVAIETELLGGLSVAHGGTGLTAAGTSGNVLTSDGSVWASAAVATSAALQDIKIYTGNATWTKPAGLSSVVMTVLAGGGGGGGAATTDASQATSGGGGGGQRPFVRGQRGRSTTA